MERCSGGYPDFSYPCDYLGSFSHTCGIFAALLRSNEPPSMALVGTFSIFQSDKFQNITVAKVTSSPSCLLYIYIYFNKGPVFFGKYYPVIFRIFLQ